MGESALERRSRRPPPVGIVVLRKDGRCLVRELPRSCNPLHGSAVVVFLVKGQISVAYQRPAIPMTLERQIKVEAGHRCAIPTCRQTPVELAHIEPWSKVKEHAFENMVALCPTCHARFDRGEIDQKSMRQYKANLTIISSRYGDLEKRVLELFAEHPDAEEVSVPGHLNILMKYMVDDGLVELQPVKTSLVLKVDGDEITLYPPLIYRITKKGREFVERWVGAKELQ